MLSSKVAARASACVLVAICFVAGTVYAQVTATVSGKVEDATGAAIPGASITVTSLETGAARTATTVETGTYRVLSLPVGRYEVKAELTGFKAALQTGVTLTVGQEAVVNLKLEVGATQEEVTVTGEAPIVNTTTASVSGLVGEREVKDLPLNGRSFDNLITLNPGAVLYNFKAGPSVGSGEGSYFTVAGRRPSDNLFLMNGIEYTGSSNIGITPGGVSGQLLGIDAVREFNVLSDTYSAEYGKRAGAQVSVVTQSGTNQLHGAAFEFLRNSALDARNFFDVKAQPSDPRIPPFRRNQFGGSLGGPIKKDKMFVFGNYEGFRHTLGLSNVAFVPDNDARRGFMPCNVVFTAAADRAANCGAGLNTPVQVPRLDRRMLPYMQVWPAPNGPEQLANGLATGIAKNFNHPVQTIREDFGTARFDLTANIKDTLSTAYTVDDGYNLSPLQNGLFGTTALLRSQVTSAQETHVFSPQFLNTVRTGFSRAAFNFDSMALDPTIPPDISLFAGKPAGCFAIGGASCAAVTSIALGGGSLSGRIWNYRNLYTASDDVQIVRANHQLSFGGWLQRIQVNANSAARNYGEADFASFLTFLQGTTTNWVGTPNRNVMYWRSLEGAWYVQDVWQLRPNFTVRAGVRHEFTNGWNEKYGRAAQYLLDANGVPTSDPVTSSTHIGKQTFLENNATRLFSPRVGFAWDVFGNGKTSMRAGFGMFYSLMDNLSFQMNFVAPYNTLFAFNNVSLLDAAVAPPVVPGKPLPPFCSPANPPGVASAPCTLVQPMGVKLDGKTPTVASWNYSIEQQVSRNMSLRLAYVGNHGYNNIIDIDANTIPREICNSAAGCASGGIRGTNPATLVPKGTAYFPAGTRPNKYIANAYFWYPLGINNYHALQADLTKRLSSGLFFRANYTFAKNLDNGTATASSQSQNNNQSVLDPRNPMIDYGRSALDFRHQGSGSFSYELPFGKGKAFGGGLAGVADKVVGGWQLNGIVTLLSGFPITPLVGTNRSGNGNTFNPDRPNYNPNFQGPVITGKVEQWFNPNAFSLPPLGTWGAVGRGTLNGPGLAEIDFSVFKTFPITERTRLLFRAEAFNIANKANFGVPNFLIFSGDSISPSAGQITSTTTSSRQIQFGLKLMF